MLKATFWRLINGVSQEQEQELWRQGILSWTDLEELRSTQKQIFKRSELGLGKSEFAILREALKSEDAMLFAQMLDSDELFRVALGFPRRTVFLDIETTGLSRFYDYITLIGWNYQGEYGAVIRGGDDTKLKKVLRDARIIVTYNGTLFDLPFLREKVADLQLPSVQVDLRFLSRRVGLAGGQKAIEVELGFKRPSNLKDIEGEAAPVLWHRYRRGSLDALRLLVEYNHSDIEGMKYIFDETVRRLVKARRVPLAVVKRIPRFAIPSKIRWGSGKSRKGNSSEGITLSPYVGSTNPAVTLQEITHGVGLDPIRVVGIDLTGAEIRPSGWCLLDGAEATTRMIGSDDGLVDATTAVRPHLVSIDSPLSLPRGRISVFDDDPGRHEFGIMRTCERILKKRGVNVYPALIPSMQRLTERGIRLARRFRKLGFPVIESYPGAAQDIMGIPRKRASMEMLRDGLGEFGVRGLFLTSPVVHDELDAITSAVVGLFFWGGRFEALGSEEEEALIIPDLKANPTSWIERRIVGLSGPIAAGKTTSAKIFESLGYHYTRYSLVLEGILRGEGKSTTRPSLQEFGDEVHKKLGQRWLGRKLVASLPKAGNAVIDGLRFPEDHSFLVESFGPAFRHLHINASGTVRELRFSERPGRGGDFLAAEAHPVEQHVQALRPIARAIVVNEGSVEMLKSQLLQHVQYLEGGG